MLKESGGGGTIGSSSNASFSDSRSGSVSERFLERLDLCLMLFLFSMLFANKVGGGNSGTVSVSFSFSPEVLDPAHSSESDRPLV